jgi:isopentenyl-diphosphate delta-isomerase type 1
MIIRSNLNMPKDDKKELFYWVDENDKELGSISREEAHSGSRKIHRSIYALLVNDLDQILLQKRSKLKDTYPGYWTVSTSGHVTYGQTYEQALINEVQEEIGIDPKEYTLITNMYIQSDKEREISKIYLVEYNNEKIKIDKTEIETVEWVDIKNLKSFEEKNKITPAGRQALQKAGLY